MTKALVIPARAEPYLHEIVDGDNPAELQALVQGWIEAYTLPGFEARMFMNEDGVRLNLPPNPVASRLLMAGVAGTVVVVGINDPHLGDVPQDLCDLFGLGS